MPTSHFRDRLRALGAPLKDKKHISPEHYDAAKIKLAVKQAKELHVDREARYPAYFATTVYLLLEKILEIPLGPAERQALDRSAQQMSEAIHGLGMQ